MKNMWKINLYLLISLFTLCGLYSCKNDGLQREIKVLIGKQICLPENISRQSEYAIINYVDTTGCTSCKLRPNQWNSFVENAKKQNIMIDVIFFVHPNVYSDVKAIVDSNCKQIKVLMDNNNWGIKEQALPQNEMLHTFLIDKNNKIVFVGNPATNGKIEKMMLSIVEDSFEKKRQYHKVGI